MNPWFIYPLAQSPVPLNPKEFVQLVDTVHSWDGYMWACGIVVFFTLFFLAGVWHAVRAAKEVIRENRDVNQRYTGALEKYAGLLATYTSQAQDLVRDHQQIVKEQQGLDRSTNDLIRADTAATLEAIKKSEQQTKALEQLKETVHRLWERDSK